MGFINTFNLSEYIDKYGCNRFVESGTFRGDGVAYANTFDFESIESIEIIESLYTNCNNRFSDIEKIKIYLGNSETILRDILVDEATYLFWLDAHFPGADAMLSGYGDELDTNIRIPLENELRAIRSIRPNKNDVFILDDLRIYEDGPFTSGNWSDRKKLGGINCNFINELFEETSNITKIYTHEGYIIITPKNS